MNALNINLFSIGAVLFLIGVLFYRLRAGIFYKFHGKLDEMEAQANLLEEGIREKNSVLKELPPSCEKISFLFDVSLRLVELYDRDSINKLLIDSLRDLFPEASSVLLFIVQDNKESLLLEASFKREDFIIEEKYADILDIWVLRHNHSLLVNEIKSDFRFDYSKVVPFNSRGMISFMACPLSIGQRLMGVIRLESRQPSCFSMEDSRILRSICDLGAVVLERASLFKRTQDLAVRDSLTGLFLKNYFFDRLEEEIKRAYSRNIEIGVIMIDIDDFKKINDAYGHVVGDLVLKRLAKILIEVVGDAGNVISRFGGEEFIVFFAERDKEQVLGIAEQIRRIVKETIISFRRQKLGFTISAGGAFYPQDGKRCLEIVEAADKRLYKAKRDGKNRVYF